MPNESKKEKFERKIYLGEMDNLKKEMFKELIREYKDIFEYDEEKLGRVNKVKHEIEVKEDQEPIAQKRYRETEEKEKDFEEHLKHVNRVLNKLRENNMIAKLKKCQFGLRNINFLGHIVGKDGLRPDEKKVEKIKSIKRPETVTEVRSFLGLCSYYRRFIKDFAKIAKPLHNLTKKDTEFEWKEEQQVAFDILRTKLIEKPILIYPDFDKEFILITDGSKIGLGAVLAQMNEDNKEAVIAYVNGKEQTGRRARWVMKLQQFDFKIVHRSGKKIKNADALSRLQFEEKDIKRDVESFDQELNKMDYNKEKKLRYAKSGNKWFNAKRFRGKWDDMKYFNDKEAILLNLEDKTEKELLKRLGKESKPQIVIVEGVDGTGKTTIVENVIKQLKDKDKLKVRFNTFKRRRNDDERFKEPSKEYEWLFRKQVVEEINRRMTEFDDEDIIILDKSPYSEYFYQKTKSFDRGLISPYGNHKMEKEIFKYKDIIDNAVVIFLENDECWKNYIGRETKKSEKGHKSSYDTLNEEEYMDMVKMFKEYQNVYENEEKYRNIKIKNDNESWKKVYKQVEILLRKVK
ncbi:zinc knuckle protein [Rhizophagus irregularis DAOM 181602=DAOM 197198]|nr:zinc knuckle protein [Rhizophagus irregularis DAOM 181602=DAOM 197198]